MYKLDLKFMMIITPPHFLDTLLSKKDFYFTCKNQRWIYISPSITPIQLPKSQSILTTLSHELEVDDMEDLGTW